MNMSHFAMPPLNPTGKIIKDALGAYDGWSIRIQESDNGFLVLLIKDPSDPRSEVTICGPKMKTVSSRSSPITPSNGASERSI
jgi:hypothetical protein